MINHEEITRLQLTQARLEVLKKMMLEDKEVPVIKTEWALKYILGMTDQEIQKVLKKDPNNGNK